MIKLSEHLFCYKDTCNVYLIKQGKHGILVDFGSGGVLGELGQAGVGKVDGILVTHHHRDQVQGLTAANKAGIPIFVPHTEQDLIGHARQTWLYRPVMNNYNNRQDRFSLLEDVRVEGTLKDYSVFEWRDMKIEVWPTPGHTTGSVSLLCELDGRKSAFTGDLIYGPGKVWSLAATQWSYNGGEGIPHSILSLLSLQEKGEESFYPSHGEPMSAEAAAPTIENLSRLRTFRRHNPRLFELREKPYEALTPHLLFNRTSMSNSYVLLSDSGKAAIFDFGYDFMAGAASGEDRSARRPWLYTIPYLFREYGVESIDICICTHYHDDHVAGFNLLRDTYGTKVLCPENFAHILEHPYEYDLPCLWYDSIPVDIRLPMEQSFVWEEYEIIVHALSGHTKYSAAFEFTADGKKVLCSGDQYADDDGLFLNYVYKNMFEAQDFAASARLYEKVKPDLILTGHWQRFDVKEDYSKALLERGLEMQLLHNDLLPLDNYKAPSSDFCGVMYPYQLTAAKGETVSVRVDILNPYPTREMVSARLVLPEGCSCSYPIQEGLACGNGSLSLTYEITVPEWEAFRLLVGCDLTVGEHHLGQHCEMMIHVL